MRPEKLAQNEKLYDPITQKLIAENMETVTKDGVKVKDLVELQRNVIFMTPQQKAAYEAMFNTVMAELKGKATPAAEVVPAGVTTPAPEKKPAATGGKMKSRDFDPNMD